MAKVRFETEAYNPRRYSRPWIARVEFPKHKPRGVFHWGEWVGSSGEAGVLVLDGLSIGDIVARGQKDRRGNGTTVEWYQVTGESGGEATLNGLESKAAAYKAAQDWVGQQPEPADPDPEPEPVPLDHPDFTGRSVPELRRIARKILHSGFDLGVDFQWVNRARKSELIEVLARGPVQEHKREPRTVTAGPEPKPEPTGPAKPEPDLAAVIARAIQGHLEQQKVDTEAILELVDTRIKESVAAAVESAPVGVTRVVVERLEKSDVDLGATHKRVPELIRLAQAGMDVMLVGPSGSGKTYAAEQVAEALGLEFRFLSVGLQTSKADLIGYMDAHGNYVRTPLRDAYEHGGLFLLDEVDAGNPNVLTVLNAMTANSQGAFPDGMVARHKDFRMFAAANTYGYGQTREYVGRNRLDGATLDRFVVVDFPYDEELEKAIAMAHANGNAQQAAEWVELVQRLRAAAERERVIISPRASIRGAALIGGEWTRERLLDVLVWRGINPDTRERIERGAQG